MWFSTRPDINRPVQAQKQARNLKFWSLVEEELYYPSSENKGADQLRGYREADLRLCFRHADCWFSHEVAHIIHYHKRRRPRRETFLSEQTVSISARISNIDLIFTSLVGQEVCLCPEITEKLLTGLLSNSKQST